MKRFTIYALLGLALSSCVTRERCLEKFPPSVTETDSVFHSDSTIVIRDTVIVPGETVTVRLNIPCPEVNMEKIFKKNGTTAHLIIKDGIVTCEAKTDSLTRIIENLTRTIKEGRSKSRKEVAPPQYIKFIPWWVWFLWGISLCGFFYLGGRLKIFNR